MSTKRKVPATLAAPVAKTSAKTPFKSTIDESKTSVFGTTTLPGSSVETIEISSDEDHDDDDDDDDDNDNNSEENASVNGNNDDNDKIETPKPGDAMEAEATHAHVNGNGHVTGGGDGDDKEMAHESDEGPTSPSFGELLRENEAIDVPAMLQQTGATSTAAVQRPRTTILPLGIQSLGTVLTQALRTDDKDLLESCLQSGERRTIQGTIERLDSSLAGTLLAHLASRLHRRPGRAGTLTTWVHWTLVVHGGALLSSQPKLVEQLGSLQKVLAERARGLNSLLALQGKLDLLEGQLQLRRKMKSSYGHLQDGEDDEDDVVFVEGETDVAGGVKGPRRRGRAAITGGGGEGSDDDEDVPIVNGFSADSEDDELDDGVDDEDQDDEGSDGALALDDDDEDAEENNADESMGEDEEDDDHDDEEEDEEEESDADAAQPPAKARKVSHSSKPRRK